ncbi:hypothetical protein D9757_000270 [Collybiopsis confluens]|uniref:Splicing factor Cactin n=1 Tax=Collybiopsis confluens TaxID=2823264 RepID=A0A8H5I1U3_9AGAR|nr:hypothetical protein D9757_000270 [Collybiopsis confluens]
MARHSSRSVSPRRRHEDRDRDRDRLGHDDRKRKIRDHEEDDREHSRRRDKHRDRSSSRDGDKKKRKRDKSEERKARKAEKKRIKEEEEARQIAELSVYSATDNPFHDVNLGQQFRWHKKNEKERKEGLTLAESQRRDAIRRQDAKEELERLNKRRAEREVEQRLREEEEMRMQRLQESAHMSDWLSKEGEFRLEQERNRAAIRIQEKRAKAIDFLALNLKYVNPPEEEGDEEEDAGLEIDLDEPYNILDNLSNEQVEELHDDIERYMTLETSDTNIDFWTNMMVVCKDRLDRIKASRRMGIEAAAVVESDIAVLLSGKTYNELASLQRQVQAKLTSGEPVDTDYWEALLKKILVWKAKANLKNLHEVVVRNRLEQLRKRQRDEALQAQEELLAGVAQTASTGAVPVIESTSGTELKLVEPYDRSMSPPLIDITKLTLEERQVDILTEEEDRRNLIKLRQSVAASRFVPKQEQQSEETSNEEAIASSADMASEALYRAEAERELDEEEELFNMEENIVNPTSYNWEDKYRPRKPRYFNRVHTGYEWNKYNQTHYDTDNPPPKVVQGYKFNIFYPDLIDKSKAPTYKIIKEPGNDETVLLFFSAGPPYEDIAFRIVNLAFVAPSIGDAYRCGSISAATSIESRVRCLWPGNSNSHVLQSFVFTIMTHIFLALLYIRKLFPSGLHTMIHRYPIDNQAKLIFRAFCLALFLAFKWLDDFRLHIGGRSPVAEQQKSESPKKYRSCWADFLSMSVAEVRIAEISALNVLNWNISVSAPEWHFWLDELHDYTVLRPDSASFTTAVDLITTAQEELGRTCPEAPFMSSPPRENSSRSSLEPLIRALLVGIAPPVLQSSSPVEGSPELEVGLHCPQPILAGGLTGVIGYVAGPSPRTVTQSDYEHLENPDLSLEHLLCEDIRSQDWQPFDDPQLSTPVFVNPWRCQTHHDFGELYLY